MKFEFDTNEYEDIRKADERVASTYSRLNNNLIKLGIDYANFVSGSLNSERFYSIRNSILSRLHAALFHKDLLMELNISGVKCQIPTTRLDVDGFKLVQKQDFLFDSIIFHLVSAIDYFSCLIKINTIGNISDWKSTWNKLKRKLNSNRQYSNEPLIQEYLKIDNLLFGRLNDYRADLIHYTDDGSQFSTTHYTGEGTVKIEVKAPHNFYQEFRKILSIGSDESLTINTSSLWIIERVMQALNHLIDVLRKYLERNRIRPEGTEVIKTNIDK